MKTIAHAIIAAAIIVAGVLLGGRIVSAAPTDPDDPQALANVWTDTVVVFPQDPANYFIRAGRNMDSFVEKHQPKNLPVVIFLHGCSGLYITSTQVTKMVHAYAAAGFVVFAPNSLDRPRKPFCASPTQNDIDATSIPQRLGELRSTLAHVKALPWVDASNIVLAGHSLGGWTVSQWSGPDFRAAVITGATCQPTDRMRQKPGVQLPPETAVISVLGANDEWFPYNLSAQNCGAFKEMHAENRKFVLLKGMPHDVTKDPEAMPMIVRFISQYLTRPLQQ